VTHPELQVPGLAPAVARAERIRMRVWRGFIVGLLLLPLNSLWVIYMESISGHGPYVSTISMFFQVIFTMVFVALGNAVLRRLWRPLALNRAELIIVYVMLTISTSIAGHDMLQVLVPIMTVGYWYATPQNHWEQMLNGAVPPWLVISDQQVLYGYWNGASSLYQPAVLHAWLSPVMWWTGFVLALMVVLLCISVVVRPLWSDRERLTFPIIQLPLQLTDPDTPLARSRLMWIGFAIAAAFNLLNGLNAIFPAVPRIPVYVDLAPLIQNQPWNGVGWLPVTFYPSVIGLCFLMPLDLLFSCTVFFFWWKLLFIIAAATGVSRGYTGDMSTAIFPWKNEQMFGGFIAIAVASPLVGRRYFQHVWRRILGRPSEVDDAGEGMSFRTAAIGAVLGFVVLVAMSVHTQMSYPMAISFFAIYFLLAVAVARIRAEFGSPVHDFHFTGPDYTLSQLIGTANLRPQDLGMFTQYFWFNRAYRAHLVADAIEGVQMRARARSPGRAMVAAILLATVAATVAGFWLWLHFAYQDGAASRGYGAGWFGQEAYGRLQEWLDNRRPANFVMPVAMAAGFAITMLLATARTTFAGWPLHPVAYALSASWSIHLVWTPMLIAWLIKSLVLRYGGLRLYRQAVPLFFGLILGESIVGCAWPLIGLIWKLPSYNFFGG
jgi:hypothetical protein